jgi:hypothetical protein
MLRKIPIKNQVAIEDKSMGSIRNDSFLLSNFLTGEIIGSTNIDKILPHLLLRACGIQDNIT